jgi:hypothetical protein
MRKLTTKRKKDQQNFYTCTNQGRINLNDTAVYISWIMSAILCMMILCGNSLILCISLFDKSLNSPISVTLQGLSIISIINAVFFAKLGSIDGIKSSFQQILRKCFLIYRINSYHLSTYSPLLLFHTKSRCEQR